MISVDKATVYRAPTAGRRYFTKRAAINAEARALIFKKYPIEGGPFIGHEGPDDDYINIEQHEPDRFATMLRRMKRLISQAMAPVEIDPTESRFVIALANHERLLQQVGQMKKQIGAHLAECPVMKKAGDWKLSAHETKDLFDEKGLVKTHLWGAFNELIEGSYGMVRMESDDQENYLTDPWNDDTRCDHCYAAWKVIQERKEVRQELGRARRALRQLGKSALKVTQ